MSHIFISFVAEDKNIAMELSQGLEAAGYITWHYFRDSIAGVPHLKQVNQAIEECKALIVITSDVSLNSNDVSREIEVAHDKEKIIVPLLSGIEYDEVGKRQPAWQQAFGAAVAKAIPADGVSPLFPQIIEALKRLQIYPQENDVTGLLRAMGFEVLIANRGDRNMMFEARRMTTGTYIHRWYLYQERPVTLDDAEMLRKKLEGQPGATGWIVTDYAIDIDAQRLIEANRLIAVHSLSNFYRQMLQYDRYLKELSEGSPEELSDGQPEINEIKQYWVNLQCSEGDTGRFNIVEYLDGWIRDDSGRQVAILGDFGTGKTWLCRYYAARLAKQHLENPDHHRIPILIPLRGYAKALKIEQLITETLLGAYHIDLLGGFETFMHLNRCGRLLLLFDGFDEMEQRVEYTVAMRNFKEILRVVVESSKVILTSRPLFFSDRKQLQTVLKNQAQNARFETLTLRVFEDDQIKEVLQKRAPSEWQECWNEISELEQLKRIASRPVMTQIIAEALPAILRQPKSQRGKLARKLNAAELYRTYIVHRWIERACRGDERLLEIKGDVLLFLREIAWEMFRGPASQTISQSEFRDCVNERFQSYDLTLGLERLFVYDQQSGNYAFPHPSFMEYFVAERIAEDLSRGNGQALFGFIMTDGILAFLADLAQTREELYSGILNALPVAKPDEQINTLVKLLTMIGKGNPLKPIIKAIENTGAIIIDLPQHTLEPLASEQFIGEVFKRPARDSRPLAQSLARPVCLFFFGLMSSPTIGADRAVKELTAGISNQDADTDVRLHAVKAFTRRQGEQEAQTLIGVLHQVIADDDDNPDFRLECVAELVKYDFREALEPLIPILNDFDHQLWLITANFISKTSVSSLADQIETDIIRPNESDDSLIKHTVFLKSRVRMIRSNAAQKSKVQNDVQGGA
jgi:TIR domain/NACHT domain